MAKVDEFYFLISSNKTLPGPSETLELSDPKNTDPSVSVLALMLTR